MESQWPMTVKGSQSDAMRGGLDRLMLASKMELGAHNARDVGRL